MAAPAPSRLALRLDALSRDELLELVVEEVETNAEFARRADSLVSRRHQLPSWCVDEVLLSPDLLPHVIEWLSLCDVAAATAHVLSVEHVDGNQTSRPPPSPPAAPAAPPAPPGSSSVGGAVGQSERGSSTGPISEISWRETTAAA